MGAVFVGTTFGGDVVIWEVCSSVLISIIICSGICGFMCHVLSLWSILESLTPILFAQACACAYTSFLSRPHTCTCTHTHMHTHMNTHEHTHGMYHTYTHAL